MKSGSKETDDAYTVCHIMEYDFYLELQNYWKVLSKG